MDAKRAAEGLTIIAVGLILLGNTFGVVPWGVWWNILSLWPLLIIAAGVDIIGRGAKNSWLRVISSLLVVAGLAYGVFVMPVSGGYWSPFLVTSRGEYETFSNSTAHDSDVLTGKAEVNGAVGKLTVSAGSDLVSASGKSPFTPVYKVKSAPSGADVKIGLGNGNWVAPNDEARLDVKLDRTVAWDLDIDGGVSSIDADLSELTITSLLVKTGVSSGKMTLGAIDVVGDENGVPVLLDTGVSTFTLRIREGDAVRLKLDRGLSNIVRPPGLELQDAEGDKDVYVTDGFSESGRFWDIILDAGISNVRIEFY